MEICKYMEHGHDEKYFVWRRVMFRDMPKKRNCYCSDLDLVKCRNRRSISVLEFKKGVGNLKNAKAVISHFVKINKGSPLELCARLIHEMNILAFLIAIGDLESTVKILIKLNLQ